MTQKISIIIPVFNEEQHISRTLYSLKDYFRSKCLDYELVVIDDCSTDKSLSLIKEYSLLNNNMAYYQNEKNRGKGYSIRKGLLLATGDCFLTMDADLSTDIECFPDILNALMHNDIVIGSRYVKGSVIAKRQGLMRVIYSRTFNYIIKKAFGLNISDTQNGFVAYNMKARAVMLKYSVQDRFCYSVEHFLIAQNHNLRFSEISIFWTDAKPQKFTKHIPMMIKDLIDIYKNNSSGIYG